MYAPSLYERNGKSGSEEEINKVGNMREIIFGLVLVSSICLADEKGKQSYATRCASCHGVMGQADGVVAKSLPPGIVTNLVKGPFKFVKTEEQLKELIVKGGAALKLNAMMPPAPGIAEDELSALAKYVMSMRQ